MGILIAGALPKETQVIHQLYGESLLFTHSPHSKDHERPSGSKQRLEYETRSHISGFECWPHLSRLCNLRDII